MPRAASSPACSAEIWASLFPVSSPRSSGPGPGPGDRDRVRLLSHPPLLPVRWRWLGSLLDLLFWLLVTLGLFLHALDTGGGVLRFYMVAAVLGGAIGYFLLLSPLFLFLGYRMADFAGHSLSPGRLSSDSSEADR